MAAEAHKSCLHLHLKMIKKCKNEFNFRLVHKIFGLTSKVGAVSQLHLLIELGDDTCDAMLDEIHLLPHCALSDDVVIGLKDLELQLAQHPRYKVGVCVGKQRHGGHQLTAIEVDNFLVERTKKRKQVRLRH